MPCAGSSAEELGQAPAYVFRWVYGEYAVAAMGLIRLTRAAGAVTAATAETTLTLPYDQRTKSRLRVTLDDGREAGLFLERGSTLKANDLLSDGDGLWVRIVAAPETVSTVACDEPLLLARACYHLGNRHVPLQIDSGRLRYQHDHVLDEMVRGLGLQVGIEQAPFEPEAGAYGGGHGHHHEH